MPTVYIGTANFAAGLLRQLEDTPELVGGEVQRPAVLPHGPHHELAVLSGSAEAKC